MAQDGCLGWNEKKKQTKFKGCLIKYRLLQHGRCIGMGTGMSAEGLGIPRQTTLELSPREGRVYTKP